MTEQSSSPEPTENASVAATVKDLIKKNKKKAIIGAGAAAVLTARLLIELAKGRNTTADITSDEPAEPEETSTSAPCADGWESSSIGKQGACSHHGGLAA
ncbi:hypothetical protein [Streptomyces sp. NBC_01022]|uniref:hypothetical protein n=1 Tax=Streptomyces sp. NBC_01022 TaxID=2903723 RepID=UPI002DD99DCA|nr:hypothetical protein [Streptomyces sp. NBC_01022]WRZ82661.1 hypothetical protein OG316_21555 [Streptomyces sp. NBC_01022]